MNNTNSSLETIILGTEKFPAPFPSIEEKIQTWAQSALVKGLANKTYEVNYQFVSPKMMQTLNREFRKQDKPTNALSFPSNEPFDSEDSFIGDIAISLDILKKEAEEQEKSLEDHMAHLVIHSLLHCQGFDHMTDTEAAEMEALEILLLSQHGITDPYSETDEI
jgi:probable rRNA maturation factor